MCTIWYMRTNCTIEVDAPVGVVWEIFTDVERWPEWTASVTSVTALDGSELEVGRRYEIRQPRLPRLIWEVTHLDAGTTWTWRQRSPGASTAATHEVVDLGAARSLVRQRLEQSGPIGTLTGRLTQRLTRRYLDLEAKGLKARAEVGHARATSA